MSSIEQTNEFEYGKSNSTILFPNSSQTRQFGRVISSRTPDEERRFYFDPYGRSYFAERKGKATSIWRPVEKSVCNTRGEVLQNEIFLIDTDTASTIRTMDAFGQVVEVENALENTISYSYDLRGRTTSVAGAAYPTRYQYDTAGRLTGLSTTRDGENWDTTSWTYDPTTGYLLSKTYSDGSVVHYTRRLNGKPIRTTTARGVWKENEYNAKDELTSVEYSGNTPTDTFSYDADGNTISANNAIVTITAQYSALGIATNEVVSIGTDTVTIARGLDSFSRENTLNVTGQPTIEYTYNSKNQLSAVCNNNAFSYPRYALDGLPSGYVLRFHGQDLNQEIFRDIYRRELLSEIATTCNNILIRKYSYVHDDLGRRTSRTDNNTSLNTFGYNTRDEVITAKFGNEISTYNYDDAGNFTTTTQAGNTHTYTANGLNQYTQIDLTPISSDLDGNLLTNGVWSYTWDDANRLSTVLSNGVFLATHQYDAYSRRARKITPSATHTYFYDGWNLILEYIDYPDNTRDIVSYVWGNDLSGSRQGAGGVGGLLWVKINGHIYAPVYDANGNITAYIDEYSTVVASYEYDALGHTITQSGSMANVLRYRFSTKYYDEESGLYYYGYRFYSPEIGRWLNRDPIEENGGENMYSFCSNCPVIEIDLLGKFAVSPFMFMYNHAQRQPKPSIFHQLGIYESLEDEHVWFEENYPGWLNAATTIFVNEITKGISCTNDLFQGPSSRQSIYPFSERGMFTTSESTRDNEILFGDNGQSYWSADRVLGSFVIDYVTPIRIEYSCINGKQTYSWETEMYIEDTLGLQTYDPLAKVLGAEKIFPSKRVKRARWKLRGEGECDQQNKAIPKYNNKPNTSTKGSLLYAFTE